MIIPAIAAVAQLMARNALPLFPGNTTVTDYQGLACGVSVSQGTFKQGYCNVLLTNGIGIQQTETGSCSFTLYSGSTGCDPGPDGTNAVKRVVPIPNGNETTCVETGVLDGGKFQKASGVWVCG